MPLSKSTALQIGFLALLLAIAGCFDWNMPSDYGQGPDGDGDADSDADGDGWLTQGDVCSNTSECAAGYECGGLNGDPFMICRQSCLGNPGVCSNHGANSICLSFEIGGDACSMSCDVFWPDCPNGSPCVVFDTGDMVTYATFCAGNSGFGMDGDFCESEVDCAIGHACVSFLGGDYVCSRFCPNPGGSDDNCLSGQCGGFDPMIRLVDGRNIGTCIPPDAM